MSPHGRSRCVSGVNWRGFAGRYRCVLRHDHRDRCKFGPVGIVARIRELCTAGR